MGHKALNRIIFNQLRKPENRQDLEVMLKDSSVPVLIIWGAQDRVLHVSGANILKSVIPNAMVKVMEGVGHVPMVEKPEKTAGLYLHFLDL